MKTFITSSLLAMLSAVVCGWYLVKTGGEMPRRSPESYPPMAVGPAFEEEAEVNSILESVPVPDPIPESAEEPVDLAGNESEGALTSATDPKPTLRRVNVEQYGPPAPVLPFVLNINAAENEVSVQGSIPTREMKLAISRAVATAFEEETIVNRLKFSPETRSGLWIQYLPDFVQHFFQYTGGNHEMTIVDEKLILAGSVATEKAKAAVLEWAMPLKRHGLMVEEAVDLDETLTGKIAEIPDSIAKGNSSREDPAEGGAPDELVPDEVAVATATPAAPDVRGEEISSETLESVAAVEEESEASEELVFLAPFEEQYQVHTVPDLRSKNDEVAGQVHISGTRGEGVADEALPEVEEALEKPFVDDGGPLIFEFSSPTGGIVSSDQKKIDVAIERAQKARSIIYVTGYSDYRGSFEQNQDLALIRANRIKDLIFAGDIADQVTAEVRTRGDTLSRKRPGKETGKQLRRSRRVVVEVYYLK